MLARAHTFTIDGLHTRRVERRGRRAARAAARSRSWASRTRRCARRASASRAAICNCGYEFPARRITANLRRASCPKAGPGLDLALACALLAASGQLPREGLAAHALFGELALDGAVRGRRGTLAVAQATLRAGLKTLCLAARAPTRRCCRRACDVAVVRATASAVRVLQRRRGDPLPRRPAAARRRTPAIARADLADVRGQRHAVRGARDRGGGRAQLPC